jgi:hypothetical protein
MTDISLPAHSPPIRSLARVERIAAILAVALVAALVVGTIQVEECRIVPGAFSSAFSRSFDVSRRRVCGQSALAVVLSHKIEGAARVVPH